MKCMCFVIVAFLCTLTNAGGKHKKEKSSYCSNPIRKDIPILYLTLNPISTVSWLGKITQRQLVLNWKWPTLENGTKSENQSQSTSDWIGLFNISVSNGLNLEAIRLAMKTPLKQYPIKEENVNQGRIVTNITLEVFEEPLELRKLCLGNYFVAYFRNGNVLNSNCLETSPNWMTEMKEVIQDVPFSKLMIPGTHDSGATKNFKGYFAHNIANRYSINQEETIWNQLVMGIRFLDIRVKLYDTDEKASIVHGPRTFAKLQPALEQIRRFLNQTKEVVFLNIHRFNPEKQRTMQDSSGHQKLKLQLNKVFEEYMVPFSSNKSYTLRECWIMNKRLFVSYNHQSHKLDDKLWPGVRAYWSSKDKNSSTLHTFLQSSTTGLEQCYAKSNCPFSVLMAHLSFEEQEVESDVINLWFGKYNGIRYMANSLAEDGMDGWFREEFWQYTNFVATDFFTSNNLIQISKESNIRRQNLKQCKMLKRKDLRENCTAQCV